MFLREGSPKAMLGRIALQSAACEINPSAVSVSRQLWECVRVLAPLFLRRRRNKRVEGNLVRVVETAFVATLTAILSVEKGEARFAL